MQIVPMVGEGEKVREQSLPGIDDAKEREKNEILAKCDEVFGQITTSRRVSMPQFFGKPKRTHHALD